jgi:hypothetical protein
MRALERVSADLRGVLERVAESNTVSQPLTLVGMNGQMLIVHLALGIEEARREE